MSASEPEEVHVPADEMEVMECARRLGAAFWQFLTMRPRPSAERVAGLRGRIDAMLDVQTLHVEAGDE